MSRGNREVSTGNIKLSMRDNYSEHGVEDVGYYNYIVLSLISNSDLPKVL